jgi:hypothetical protein
MNTINPYVKSALVLICILILIRSESQAQDEGKKARLGLTVYPTLAWISPDNTGYNNDGTQLGIKYGLTADLRLFENDNYSFATGFLIHHTGGKLSYPTATGSLPITGPGNIESKFKLTYMGIPLAIKLRTAEIGYMRYWGLFGTELGFNISANEVRKETFASESNEEDRNADEINLIRFALVFGAGIEYNISGNTHLVGGVSYSNGLSNIISGDANLVENGVARIDENGETIKDGKLKTRLNYFSLHIGVIF